jgi:HEAT repeat protein
MRSFLFGCAITIGLAGSVLAQIRDRAAKPASTATSDAATIAAGWNALAAGRADAAVKEADAVLKRRPWDRTAILLKVHALTSVAPLRGLDAYEGWLAARHVEDVGFLEPVVIGILQEIANARDAAVQRSALRALAAARVIGSQEKLDALSLPGDASLDRDVEAARGGDVTALQRLNGLASTPAGGTADLAKALAEIGSAGQPGLLLLLNSGQPQTRAAAAEALGPMKMEAARDALTKLLQDADPVVRMSATISLAQMGDPAALARVDRMLTSDVPDVQLAAARAWEGRPGPWVEVVRPLLSNPDGVTRLEAARAIAPVDPEAARSVLGTALGDANPVIRYESARVLGETFTDRLSPTDVVSLRQRLRDPDRAVRLTVASILLRLARS